VCAVQNFQIHLHCHADTARIFCELRISACKISKILCLGTSEINFAAAAAHVASNSLRRGGILALPLKLNRDKLHFPVRMIDCPLIVCEGMVLMWCQHASRCGIVMDGWEALPHDLGLLERRFGA